MEKANSAGHQLSQCGNNDMLDGSLDALYRTGHVVVDCGLFGTRGKERSVNFGRKSVWIAMT